VGNGKFWANEGTRLPRNGRSGDKILNRLVGPQGKRVGVGRVGESFPHWRVSAPEARGCANHPYANTPSRPYADPPLNPSVASVSLCDAFPFASSRTEAAVSSKPPSSPNKTTF
jgi:hypothetical protein